MMSHYDHHLFFCTNLREDGSSCCGRQGAQKLRDYAKQQCKSIPKEKSIRVNSAGCLNRCDHGPVLVIYPEAVWYRYIDKQDVDEIIECHLNRGEIVERLLVKD